MLVVFFAAWSGVAVWGAESGSIIGSWQFDSARTMIEHIQILAVQHPKVITPHVIEEQTKAFEANAAEADSFMSATITEKEILFRNRSVPERIVTYQEIGGSGDTLRLDATSADGRSAVLTVRFVEGGIAMETVDCQSQPHVCEERKTQSDGDSLTAVAGAVDPSATQGPRGQPPRWIYLRRIDSP